MGVHWIFGLENLENHKEIDEQGNKTCKLSCKICGDKPLLVFNSGETYVDHMNEKHRSIVGVNWFQCVHCLKLNKRYFNRYYPTKRSLQLHLASMHGQQNQPGGHRVVINQIQEPKTSEIPPLSTYSTVNNQLTQNVNNQLTQNVNNQLTTVVSTANEIYVPINSISSSNNPVIVSSHQQSVNNQLTQNVNNQLTQSVNNQLTQNVNNQLTQNVNNQLTATSDDTGQQIIQQFQIQLPDQTQLVDQQTQQIQIIQSDPNNPEQPQVITLYTWGGN